MIMISNLKANAMNKVMYFMANCGYDAVKELIYNSFDKNMADHIFDKYMEIIKYSSRPFFELYFIVDSDCKKAILNYIENNYNIPEI